MTHLNTTNLGKNLSRFVVIGCVTSHQNPLILKTNRVTINYSITNLDISLFRFIVLEYVTSSSRFVFWDGGSMLQFPYHAAAGGEIKIRL